MNLLVVHFTLSDNTPLAISDLMELYSYPTYQNLKPSNWKVSSDNYSLTTQIHAINQHEYEHSKSSYLLK